LKAVHHILVSSAETKGAFHTGFDTVNLHRPTWASRASVVMCFEFLFPFSFFLAAGVEVVGAGEWDATTC
jgi:hypothetical protein